jgi:phosphatidylglycerophosphate synthase
MKRGQDEMKAAELDKTSHIATTCGLITSPLTFELQILTTKGFNAIKYYYANIVDYMRIVLLFVAYHYLHGLHDDSLSQTEIIMAGLSTFSSVLLDWIDGPLARRYQQCSYFGLAVDYIADALGDIILLCWFSIEPAHYVLCMVSWFNVCLSVSNAAMGSTLSYVGIEYTLPLVRNYEETKKYVVFGSVIPAWFWKVFDVELSYVNSTTMSYTRFGELCWVGYYWWQVSVASIVSCQRIGTCDEWLLRFHWISVAVFFVPYLLEIWLGVAYTIVQLSVWSERIIALKEK